MENRVAVLLRRIIFSWLLAVTIEFLFLPSELKGLATTDGMAEMSLFRVVLISAGGVLLLYRFSEYVKTELIERWGSVGLFGILAVMTLIKSFTWSYFLACVLVLLIFICFGVWGWDDQYEILSRRKKRTGFLWATVILSIIFFIFAAAWTVGKVYSFSTPTYDFTIFSQMFYHMKESGLPLTTVERDGMLSHFAVHVSPIFYLLLPFYCLVPVPATLQVLQAAVITSAVIPLWKIGNNHGLSGFQKMLVCAVLLLFPAFSGGTSYDIHENCFLTPLVLWLFYGLEKKNAILTAISAVLVLMVKEDAAVFVAVISLWLMLKSVLGWKNADRRDLITGISLLAVSLLWFAAVTEYINEHGDGVMTWRYSNFFYGENRSLAAVIKVALMNPMKALYECVDAEKLKFIGQTMLPLLGLPLLTRKYERYILLIPYVLVNLMPDYQYQHDIFFQYTFASNAFLIYLVILNLSDLKIDRHRTAVLAVSGVICAACFGTLIVPRAISYPKRAIQYFDYYQEIRDTLAVIPEEATVTATTYYTTELSQRELLYDVKYATKEHLLSSDYVVLSVTADYDCRKYATGGKENGVENLIRLLEENGFEQVEELENVLVIYGKPQQIEQK